MYIGLHVKHPLFLTDFYEISIYRQIFEKVQISNFMKIRPVGAELFHAERPPDRNDVSNSRISQFFERV
jgi:hypothetical protein